MSVAMVTLGCARNEVDSEELAGRLEADGFRLVQDPAEADTVVVNTCGFVEAAKKDSVDTLLQAADLKEHGRPQAVVAVGCLAERYGKDLAASLPEADAVLGFDDYPDIAARLRSIVAGEAHEAHIPHDRRTLLPITPVERVLSTTPVPGHASGPASVRRRLDDGPTAALKLASGCDRRCSFCAIPAFRGSFVSRRPSDVLQEARWLADHGARELFLVSENSTSYGKDLGDLRLLETLLPELVAVEGVERVRVSYLQPAETRPGLIEAIAGTPGVTPYFDLSFQHASAPVLRRMRRFGDPESFLALLDQVRGHAPAAGVRSNVIVGFPGETEHDLETLCDFLVAARLDVTGVFGYSDEDGTEAETYAGKLDEDEIRGRVEHVTALVEELTSQRAAERLGEQVEVLVERIEDGPDGRTVEGRAAHQGPEVDGSTYLLDSDARVGDLVGAVVVASEGADLDARPL
ncbi:30S ribosomal protein S12 methylthiotransferase RimO [Nocardioides sp.]|uniref:30S ribosomal protein S12 methylthiotransferase RimO n=1 Tax=Nocardioides sp. TaxID=35761 RepID=UPI0026263610|nr:30S ribosomal protein S12 methylthiotransferase RimO [Nocardioides sp.]MDI6911131.1 30S ribosomal protein S12 methylthiotransferase RimO [Nocardioides sp.]